MERIGGGVDFQTESWFLILISILDVRSWVFASTRIQKEGGAG